MPPNVKFNDNSIFDIIKTTIFMPTSRKKSLKQNVSLASTKISNLESLALDISNFTLRTLLYRKWLYMDRYPLTETNKTLYSEAMPQTLMKPVSMTLSAC